VVGATASSFLTVWPKGADRPTAANLNYVAGQSVPNMVMAKVGDGGRISLFNFAGSVDLAVDVLGWFPTADSFAGLTPARLMDTRAGYTTIDGTFAGTGPIGASATRELALLGRGGIPSSGVAAVALNVAATNASAASFLTAFPSGAARPTAANLNYVPGQTVPNMVIVKLGTGGNVSLYNYAGSVDVVVDVLGWFPDNGSFTGLTPARLMDSRTTDPPPTSSTVGPTFGTTTLPQPVGNVVPGAFCSTPGATGTYNGKAYVCSNTNQAGVPYAGGEHRWRQQ
jgi:hypothetical protein